jgi:hypothetical protein
VVDAILGAALLALIACYFLNSRHR